MSGQNHKITKAPKQSGSGEKSKYSPPFFSYNKDLIVQTGSRKEIRCNPRPGDIGRMHKSLRGLDLSKSEV